MGVADLVVFEDALPQVCREAELGDANSIFQAKRFISKMCEHATSWQWVIHGDTRDYRREAAAYLCEKGKFTKAMQFALCGRGDIVKEEVGGDGVRVSPRGCGLRFCPRCSRRSGQRFLKRVGSHLEAQPHGEIVHFVLTQPVRGNEEVGAARKRFEDAWKTFYRALRKAGMKSALLTQHVKPRESWGWHYHGHCIVEWNNGVDAAAAASTLEAVWQKACKEETGREKALFCRLVCGPGAALEVGSLGNQGELWAEPEGAVQRVLQYAIRDVVQGCEEWVEKLTDAKEIGAFVGVITAAKLHRLFGDWRKPVAVPTAVTDEKGDKPEVLGTIGPEGKAGSGWVNCGSVASVFERARRQEPSAVSLLNRLNLRHWNNGRLSKRLRIVVKSALELRRAG